MTVTENVPPAAPPRHGGLRITSALLLGASLVILSVRTVEPLGDPDTLWHLLLGRHLIGSWDFGPIDPLSTLSTQPWVYNQWLPEIVAAWFESWGGLPAVAWLWVAGRVALVLATWALCRSTTSPLPAAIATLAAFAGAFAGTSARPQLVGLVMFVGAVWAVLLTAKDGRARWWLVPYTWLWACVHGLWVFGVVLGLLVAAAALVDRRGDAWQRHLLRFAVPLASTVAAALTPVGPRLVLAFVQVSGINEFIQEWQPGSTVLPTFTIVLVTVGVLLVIWFRTGHRPTWTELALVVFAVACCLYTRRTVAVAALTVAPLVAEALHSLLRQPPRPITRGEVVVLGGGATLGLVLAALVAPTAASAPGNVPLALAPRLASLPETVIIAENGVGGWLQWSFPALTPVIDTRSEVFGRDYLVAFRSTIEAKPGWQDRLAHFQAHAALLGEDRALAAALPDQLGWVEVGRADGYVLLVAP